MSHPDPSAVTFSRIGESVRYQGWGRIELERTCEWKKSYDWDEILESTEREWTGPENPNDTSVDPVTKVPLRGSPNLYLEIQRQAVNIQKAGMAPTASNGQAIRQLLNGLKGWLKKPKKPKKPKGGSSTPIPGTPGGGGAPSPPPGENVITSEDSISLTMASITIWEQKLHPHGPIWNRRPSRETSAEVKGEWVGSSFRAAQEAHTDEYAKPLHTE